MEWFSNNKNKLLDAAYQGDLKAIRHLVEKKHVPLKSCRDVIGSTPLHFAASRGHVHVVQYLVERHGVKPNLKNDKGQTAMDLARENSHAAVVSYLKGLLSSGGASDHCPKLPPPPPGQPKLSPPPPLLPPSGKVRRTSAGSHASTASSGDNHAAAAAASSGPQLVSVRVVAL